LLVAFFDLHAGSVLSLPAEGRNLARCAVRVEWRGVSLRNGYDTYARILTAGAGRPANEPARPLSLSRDDPDLQVKLDFHVEDHNYQRQEE
jgi:hypothetical protein